MENSLLIGLSRQVALRRELSVVANNLANINTPGFKRHDVLFQEYLMPVARDNIPSQADRALSYVYDRATYRDMRSGTLEATGNALDVAIDGEGWFRVQTEAGERYTRAGSLAIDRDGQLVTQSGDPVLGDGGPITVPRDGGDLVIARDGTVNAGDTEIGRLAIVQFENDGDLIADGEILFRSEADPVPIANPQVRQGTLERSNVRGIIEVSRLIEINRAYSSITRAIQRTEDLRRDAIERLSDVRSA